MSSLKGIEAVELLETADPAAAQAVRKRGREPVVERTAAQPHVLNGIRGVILGDETSGIGSAIQLDSADPAAAEDARQRGQIPIVVVDEAGEPVASGPPEWVPEGAIAHGSMEDGQYWLDGAEADYGDLFVTDADNWSAAAVITPGEGVSANGDVLSPALYALMDDGGTLVVTFNILNTTGSQGGGLQFFESPSYDHFVDAFATTQNAAGHLHDQVSSGPTLDNLALGANKMAIAFETGRMAVSINGGAVDTLAYANFSSVNEIGFYITGLNSRITAISAFENAVDDADLPVLSAL